MTSSQQGEQQQTDAVAVDGKFLAGHVDGKFLPGQVDGKFLTGQGEPPAKRRRGGRRSMNPEISAEERKRLRVLKNRESAMRSLAKKAEYSAKLETQEKEATDNYKQKRDSLEKLIAAAIALRTALDKVPGDVSKLVAHAEAGINKASTVLATDEIAMLDSVQQGSLGPIPTTDVVMNGEGTDVK